MTGMMRNLLHNGISYRNRTTNDFVSVAYNLLVPYSSNKLNLMISGGSSLSVFNSPVYSNLDMSKWNIYFCDERIEKEHNIDEAKALMTNFKCKFHDLRDEDIISDIDLAILGIGPDGHTCSLFPNHVALKSNDDFVYVDDAPKMPKKRITVTCKFLSNVKKLVFVIPPKDGVVRSVRKPHDSICDELKCDFDVYLDKSMK